MRRYYPNDMRFLKKRRLVELVDETRRKVKEKYGELVNQFTIKNTGIKRVKEVEQAIKKLNTHKLEGKCKLL